MLTALPLQAGDAAFIGMLIGALIAILIAVGVGYWVYKDASKRENNELLWAIGTGGLLFLALPIGLIAVVAYILVRGDETQAEPQTGAADGEW